MEPFAAFLGGVFAIILIIVVRRLRRHSGEDMIERQRREVARELKHSTPHTSRSDEAALLAVPEIRAALDNGRKIEAIKLLRERTGLGLKEAKELVERGARN